MPAPNNRGCSFDYGGRMHSTLHKAGSILVAATLALGSASTWATNWNVNVGNPNGLTFSPQILNISAGDTVTFTNGGGQHNITSDPGAVTTFHCSVACGTAPTGNPSAALWSQVITFSTPGTVGYHCEMHGAPGSGMFGTINVTIPVELQSFEID
ncbi:cupredoxin domain-containing protein [Dokdonella soli]|uniref:cupredoxin domain-containing protein n=1 Tax=Dokdonella soli TaxID=529810 RepID=UPI0031E1F2C2